MVTTYPDPLVGATPPPGYEMTPQLAPSGPSGYGAIGPPSEQPPSLPGKEVREKNQYKIGRVKPYSVAMQARHETVVVVAVLIENYFPVVLQEVGSQERVRFERDD